VNQISPLNQAVALAWEMLQRGNAAGAEELIRPFLSGGLRRETIPLLGAIRLQQQRFAEAAPLLARARSFQPKESRFAYLHGMALAGIQQYGHAQAAFQHAIKRDPQAIPAYLALGEAQRRMGRLDEAQSTFRKLLRVQADNVDALLALASVMAEMGQPAETDALLRKALLTTGDKNLQAILLNNLSVSLTAQGKLEEALKSLEQAHALSPNIANLDNRKIDILYRMGRFDDCIALYQKLLAQHPGDAALHRAYNGLLYRLGRSADYLKSYDTAPKTREMLMAKAQTLGLEKRGDEAHDIYAELLKRDSHDAGAQAGLAHSLMQMGRNEEAVKAFDTALGLPGANAAMFSGAAEAALMTGDAEKAETYCMDGLRAAPFDQSCLALLGTAWRMKDDPRDNGLNDYDALVRVYDLGAPDGYASMDEFNAELAQWLEKAHPDTREHLEQSLRGGTQTEGHLFTLGEPLIFKLRARIDEAVARYIAELPANDRHPFLARRRTRFAYAGAWSSRMRDKGFHINHIHHQGWISSAYYVSVPQVSEDQQARQGWLKFGEPGLDVKLKDAVKLAVQPVPGRLVLFPSYTWHGTIPFHQDTVRTTIAFDIIPQQ
jgi:tetratricopeptide (TPR) repeat protein